mmetsp:Transcript_20768/g.46299  ORF Transcript_20768/g.46299 Transcript_20768/m.46299 type:complete len:426 (-) Transcript_20768:30-1307(-)
MYLGHLALGIAGTLEDFAVNHTSAAWTDCSAGVYWDVGTHIGVQIDKLANPQRYSKAHIIPHFADHFGVDITKVCVVGFEPNPIHWPRIVDRVHKWRQQELQVVVFPFAVTLGGGVQRFHRDPNAQASVGEWGASLLHHEKLGRVDSAFILQVQTVAFVDIFARITSRVRHRHGTVPIVMKLDIEGVEFDVVPALLATGLLCQLSLLFCEWHETYRLERPELSALSAADWVLALRHTIHRTPGCLTRLPSTDDETYHDGYPDDVRQVMCEFVGPAEVVATEYNGVTLSLDRHGAHTIVRFGERYDTSLLVTAKVLEGVECGGNCCNHAGLAMRCSAVPSNGPWAHLSFGAGQVSLEVRGYSACPLFEERLRVASLNAGPGNGWVGFCDPALAVDGLSSWGKAQQMVWVWGDFPWMSMRVTPIFHM